ncbi:MAG TPA: hypothetical protein VK206_28575, partial [Anaerolineales bacterium]|nr:hypothetical protein [Anaerolineales bacterium]
MNPQVSLRKAKELHMSSVLDAISSYMFSGVPSNAVYDLIKTAWRKTQQQSWEEIYLGAFKAAIGDLRPHLASYTKDGEVSLNTEQLHKVLYHELDISIQDLTYSQLTDDMFAQKLAKAMSQSSVLEIGGHTLSSEDYEQLVGNLIRHAYTQFRIGVLADELAFRRTILDEAQLNQGLIRETQIFLQEHFSLMLGRLDQMERRLDTQTNLIQQMVAILERPAIA